VAAGDDIDDGAGVASVFRLKVSVMDAEFLVGG